MVWQSNRWRGFTVALLMTILSSGIAWSQDNESIEAQLNLTQQQKEKITELRKTFKKSSAPIKSRIRSLRQEQKNLENDGAAEAEIKKVLDKIAPEEISLSLLLLNFKRDYLAVLTPDQQKKLQRLKKK
ncbi:MAG: Spy/CpxP family protein refolding chaperone [Chlorobi bacterium]|nr:Spy/CpxP family protein refolding chaperone [Chlorobiota bacterium]